MTNRNRSRLLVEELEARNLLAVLWPLSPQNAQHRLLSTYAQYQELTVGGNDFLIHFHEGLDIIAATGDPVRAVAEGKVDGRRDAASQYDSHIIIKDPGVTGNGGEGWNYKHVVPTWKPKGNPADVGVERAWRREDEVKVVNGEGDPLGAVGRPAEQIHGVPVRIPAHLHLDRGSEVDPSASNTHRQRRPTENPLALLAPNTDTVDPKVEEIRFLVATHDRLGEQVQLSPQTPLIGERPRTDNHYFATNTQAGHVIVGQRAPTGNLDGQTDVTGNIGDELRADIDILASIYDYFGTDTTGYKLGVPIVDLSITGRLGRTTGDLASFTLGFDFLGSIHDLDHLFNAGLTRVVYANDLKSNSTQYEKSWYIVTNTNSDENQNDLIVDTDDRNRYWRSDIVQGSTWNDPAAMVAARNAAASFPDDIYTIRVKAYDQANNEGVGEATVLLDNWEQTIKLDKGDYKPTDNVQVTGGEQYRANQAVAIYVVNVKPQDGAALDMDDKEDTLNTNADGELPATNLGAFANVGTYWVVADYDGDAKFTPRLDAIREFKVTQAGAGLKGQEKAIAAVEGWEFTAPVATFSDPNPGPGGPGGGPNPIPDDDYSATIDWGDGTPASAGEIVSLGNGEFEVRGTHTYADFGDDGFYDVAITVAKTGGGQDSFSAVAAVTDAPLTAAGVTLDVNKGVLFNELLATFTDANPNGAAGDFSALIDWGDGTTSAGSIEQNIAGDFEVHGGHTYAQGGWHVVSVTISGQGGNTAYATTYAVVADDSLSAIGQSVSATAGVEFNGVVASFTDSDTGGDRPAYTATIDWGNGNLTLGTVTANGGGFDVSGTVTYPTDGTYTITVYLIDTDASTAQTASIAVVAPSVPPTLMSVQSLASGPDAGHAPLVKTFNPDGTERSSFYAYDPVFTGGVRVATGDVDGDGIPDIVTAPGTGIEVEVKVFSGLDGTLLLSLLPYPGFFDGAYVAVGDVSGDGLADIVTGIDIAGSQVKVFRGFDGALLSSFDAGFTGGVRVAVGDTDGDGFADIIAGPTGAAGAGDPAEVRVFSGLDNSLLVSILDPSFMGGAFVTAGDFDGDGLADIIVGAGANQSPEVRVFRGTDGAWLNSWLAFDPLFAGGVRVAARDINGDGIVDILAARGPGGTPEVALFDGFTLGQMNAFFAYDPLFTGGVFVG